MVGMKASAVNEVENISLSISERIADVLRREIVSAEVEPDAPIKQSHIAARFNVSQAPVREALGQLTAERYLVHQANRGVRVAPLVAAEVLETANLRITLESELVEAACGRFTIDDEMRIAAALKKISKARKVYDLLCANDEFHAALYTPAGRPIALELVSQLRARYSRYLGYMWKHSAHATASLEQHHELVALMKSGKKSKASDFLRRHIHASTDAIIACLEHD
ncbi:MAG: GntR family transcriptional regulator [Rhodospirillales bacterium]|nr:GntR family transcriptional regulator [Rhodospirillales bacterium]